MESLVSQGPQGLERFGASIHAEWIEEALKATGTASLRRRKVPAEQALWLLLGIALYLGDGNLVRVLSVANPAKPSLQG
ncbi:MAG: transposase domain-containing protein [Deltaproteobacteria bacterium]|nr:transposase domain-containing protein [Deltaproteobacteria bacterium]